MKKYLLLVCCLAQLTQAFAQDQFGLKIAPGLSHNRVHTNPDTTHFSSDGLGLNSKIGPIYDFTIKDNYYLSTGLFFATKNVAIKNKQGNIKERHELQYLQVPLLLKLYTSEVTLDTKVYVELGPLGAIKINNRTSKLATDTPFIKNFKFWEISGLFGAGIEYNLSLFTSVFAGISYQIGLSSIVGQQHPTPNMPPIFAYSDCITIDLGIKF